MDVPTTPYDPDFLTDPDACWNARSVGRDTCLLRNHNGILVYIKLEIDLPFCSIDV